MRLEGRCTRRPGARTIEHHEAATERCIQQVLTIESWLSRDDRRATTHTVKENIRNTGGTLWWRGQVRWG